MQSLRISIEKNGEIPCWVMPLCHFGRLSMPVFEQQNIENNVTSTIRLQFFSHLLYFRVGRFFWTEYYSLF
jgi:hypothetical protein